MATLSGFQTNTTIHAAFWIYKPDPTVDPTAKEDFVEVNSIQRILANAESVVGTITSVQITGNVLTLTATLNPQAALRRSQTVILSGLTNATFLNRQVITITAFTANTITASFTNANYGPTIEPAGAEATDATSRAVDIYYPETSVSTSQSPQKLSGVEAALFIYDMEALFN